MEARRAALKAWGIRLAAALAVFVGAWSAPAHAFDTTAPTAIMVDVASGRVLFQKNADRQIPPASLAKLMTVAVIFDAIRAGEITKETEFKVSEYAWRTGGAPSGGSTMFLPLKSTVSVGDLIKGIIIQSGNDATIVAAEGISGSSEAFAARMNEEAKRIGLTASHFTNPSGLPDPDMHVTVRDLAKLATYLIQTFPDEYPTFAEQSFTFNKITQRNRNPLLEIGADGLKTGHTSAAGYGLVASAARGGRRIVLAMSGMQSAAERQSEGRQLMAYGLQDFEEVTLVKQGEALGTAPVRGGVEGTVPLVAQDAVTVLVPRGSLDGLTRQIVDNGPVEAPVAKGQRLGWLRLTRGEETMQELPLVAGGAVARASLLGRIGDTIAEHLTWR